MTAATADGMLLLLLLLLLSASSGSSQHPAQSDPAVVVRDGTNRSVVLDCNYTLDASDTLFHVKWYHIRSGHSQVYQWILNMAPQASGPLKHRVNLTYRASEDANERHRALQILRPTVNLSGLYLCRVTSQRSNMELRQRLIVYAPPRQMSLYYTRHDGDLVNVTCRMEGVYPEPHVQLYRGRNAHLMVPIEAIQKYVSWQDGLFAVTAFWVTREEFLYNQTVFVCSMSIPETGHRESRQIIYPGNDYLGPPGSAVAAKGGFSSSAAGAALRPMSSWLLLPLFSQLGRLGTRRAAR